MPARPLPGKAPLIYPLDMAGRSKGIKKTSRLFNRTSAYILVLTFSAGALLYRTVSPYFDGPKGVPVRYDADTKTARVTRVIDGDTLEVRYAKGEPGQRIRLLRIDTPERSEPGYEAATAALARLVKGKTVSLEGEGPKKDKYGRWLSYVFAQDVNVNLRMVEDGWSRFETRYGRGRYASQFHRAEQRARVERRGLWTPKGWNR